MTESNQQQQSQTPPTSKADYLWSVAGKNVSYMVVKGVTALAGSAIATHLAYKYGLNITLPTLQGGVGVAVLAGMEWLHDFIKVKTGKTWL